MERISLTPEDSRFRDLDDFKYASPEKQRFLIYTGKIHSTSRVVKYETDEKLCYFNEDLRPRMGKVGFIQRRTTEGFTFDKKKKKLSIWFGKSLMKMNSGTIDEMMKDLKQNWYTSMDYRFRSVVTRMLLEKIVKRTINSEAEYVTSYVKHHLKMPALDPYLYRYAVLKSQDIYRLNSILQCSDDPVTLIADYDKYAFWEHYQNQHIVSCCSTLGVKFNWTASDDGRVQQCKQMEEKIAILEKHYRLVQEFKGYSPDIKIVNNTLPI